MAQTRGCCSPAMDLCVWHRGDQGEKLRDLRLFRCFGGDFELCCCGKFRNSVWFGSLQADASSVSQLYTWYIAGLLRARDQAEIRLGIRLRIKVRIRLRPGIRLPSSQGYRAHHRVTYKVST